MAGPGGGPPRRSHTKSRKGCETCKRRHIRCDESFPQCRNCTKHKIRCPYNDVPSADASRSTTPDRPDLMWTPEVESAIVEWQTAGVFPFHFPDVKVYSAPVASNYTFEELRLIHHVASLYDQLYAIGANSFTLWTRYIPTLLSIGATTPYVMDALLAFSAMHIAFLTDCPLVGGMAFEHRGRALSGLHEAIGSFSRETSDAILAASLVLSWQATDWPSWTQLMQGTSTVIEAMDAWKHESLFGDFISESSTFPTTPASPGPDHRPCQPREEDLDAFQRTLEQVQKLEAHLKHQTDGSGRVDTTKIQNLASFLKGSRKISPTLHINQQFERLKSLRDWLFWMPVDFLQRHRGSSNSLLAIAHLYTVALLMERMFPEIGSAYFGSLCCVPIDEISLRLVGQCASEASEAHSAARKLIQFPVAAVHEFRVRMGREDAETRLFSQFVAPDFSVYDGVPQYDAGSSYSPYSPYSNPSFSYSHEEMPVLNASVTPSRSPVTPLVLSPYPDHQYLSIPSPMYGGAYSPASSTFEGSVYSDKEDYGSWDMSAVSCQQSPMFSDAHHNFDAGFVAPNTQPVWI